MKNIFIILLYVQEVGTQFIVSYYINWVTTFRTNSIVTKRKTIYCCCRGEGMSCWMPFNDNFSIFLLQSFVDVIVTFIMSYLYFLSDSWKTSWIMSSTCSMPSSVRSTFTTKNPNPCNQPIIYHCLWRCGMP